MVNFHKENGRTKEGSSITIIRGLKLFYDLEVYGILPSHAFDLGPRDYDF